MGEGCNRCPHRVSVPVPGTRGVEKVPCNGNSWHTGICHQDPRQAGRQPSEDAL